MKIYPLQFEKIYIEKVWGKNQIDLYNYKNDEKKIGEVLLLSDGFYKSVVKNGELKNKDFTYVMNHYAKNLIGEDKFSFPFTVKLITTSDVLSYQVHPSSKSEVMYFLNDSLMKGGLKRYVRKEEIENNPKILLDEIKDYNMKAGDTCYIKPGTLHSLGADTSVFEISDNVDITYRLYDFDRGRELNLKQGLETLAPLSDLEISNKSCFKGRIYVKEEKVEGRNIIEEDENFKIIIPLEGKLAIETNTDYFDMDNFEVTLVPYDVTGYSIVGYGRYLDIKPNNLI